MKAYIERLIQLMVAYDVALIMSALLLPLGATAFVADLTWIQFPEAMGSKPPMADPAHKILLVMWVWCLGIGLVTSLAALMQLQKTKPLDTDSDYSKRMFGRALVGIGYALLIDAFLNVVAVAGFARAGAVPYLFESGTGSHPGETNAAVARPAGDAPDRREGGVQSQPPGTNQPPQAGGVQQPTGDGLQGLVLSPLPAYPNLEAARRNLVKALQIIVSLGFTIMGALFFFAKSLWVKMQAEPIVRFDERIFWAGLWFRLGEAVVFTVVVFLVLLYKNNYEASGWMPLYALLLGLSVKTAENLIAGLTQRLFGAINALVGKG